MLCIIAGEVKHHGICDLPIDKIAALAGVCRTTVQTTLHEVRRLNHITITERPLPGGKHLPNLVEIASPEWRTWITRGPTAHRPIGSKTVNLVSTTKNTDFKKERFAQAEMSKGAIRWETTTTDLPHHPSEARRSKRRQAGGGGGAPPRRPSRPFRRQRCADPAGLCRSRRGQPDRYCEPNTRTISTTPERRSSAEDLDPFVPARELHRGPHHMSAGPAQRCRRCVPLTAIRRGFRPQTPSCSASAPAPKRRA